MAAPYWGQLPGPRAPANAKGRRFSDDYGPALDEPLQPRPRANRVSVQTTNTEAPTESTLSPFASPTASSFQGQGLAPRPPTFPYGSDQYPPEVAERRKRRQSRQQEEERDEDPDDGAPPAAPDVPRAPPMSFRQPYGNGGLPFAYPAVAAATRDAMRSDQGHLAPEEYYKTPTPEGRKAGELPVLDRARKGFDPGSGSRRRSAGGTGAAGGQQRETRSSTDPEALQRRKASVASQSDRKVLADDRSPLQRLELTLDSITKEEKRARVEAAEQLAREKSTRDPDKAANQQVRFREREPSSDPQEPKSPHTPQALAAHRGPLTQNPPEEGRRYGSTSGASPRGRAPESRIPVPTAAASGIPQRNLSFRERAARNDLKLPDANGPASDSPTVSPGGTTLTRSGSNKLKKDPPGDPWFNRRAEAEKKYPAVQPRGGPSAETADMEIPTASRSAKAPMRSREPPSDDRDGLTRPVGAKITKSPNQRKQAPDPDSSRPVPAYASGRDGPAGTAAKPQPAVTFAVGTAAVAAAAAATPPTRRAARHHDDDPDGDSEDHHYVSNLVYRGREKFRPGQGMYNPPHYLDEWKKATVGTLSGAFLDLSDDAPQPGDDKDKAWWETPSKRRGSVSSRPRKAEAFDGEYDETNAPTRFKPPLYLKCGPLLRFCGIRNERAPARSDRNGTIAEREIWRGSVMIVTHDSESSYEIAPTLRMFLQPIELLPPPPAEVQGALPPEYVDPIAGHPKLGRKGETLYVRPVEHIDECKDLSRDETDAGLFEKMRSPPDEPPADGAPDPPGSFAARRRRIEIDGEKVNKHKEVRGFRLHAERGLTFWRFNIEVELRSQQQRIAYRINRGPSTGFWVPARGQSMNIMFHTCNGFSLSVLSDQLCGPDPMWRDVLNTHQTQPFHVMIGGGDQIYNDAVMRHTKIFQDWLVIKNTLHKHNAPFTAEMQDELEAHYLDRYSMWFSQGLFGLANSQIPMVNMWDDHDIIDGFGSYPHHFMNSPVFSGLGNVAFKYYMLFQHQSLPAETEATEPSWTLGTRPGPYINEVSRSLFMSLGSKLALLAVDCRTERTRDEVLRDDSWKKIMDRCYAEIVKGKTEHLLVLLGVPIAYPRLVWLENILTSRLMDPIKALGKTGMLGNFLNKFDGGVEVLDDLDDHWTAKNHKDERSIVIEDLQDLAADKSVRITILSGDVHLAAVGQFYSNAKLGVPKHEDFRYMPNVISSAIVNTPPPDLMADILNKRNKVHHFDKETDENMIPLFGHGVDGKSRNNKHLLPHRNWCSIREYAPGRTPPASPNHSAYDVTPLGTPPGGRGSFLRRLSKTRRGPTFRTDASRPPVSAGIMRTFSRRPAFSEDALPDRPPPVRRTLSLSRADFNPGNLFRRLSGRGKRPPPDDGGINGGWGPESDDDYDEEEEEEVPPAAARRLGLGGGGRRQAKAPDPYDDEEEEEQVPPAAARRLGLGGGGRRQAKAPDPYDVPSDSSGEELPPADGQRGMSLRGGAGGSYDEFENGDEEYFTVKPRRAQTLPAEGPGTPGSVPEPRPFHRTPTGLSVKQMKRAEKFEVNLEGGLDICLNVEVSQKDPAGITAPYRIVVPRLWYEYQGEEPIVEEGEEEEEQRQQQPTGIKRWISLRRGPSTLGGRP